MPGRKAVWTVGVGSGVGAGSRWLKTWRGQWFLCALRGVECGVTLSNVYLVKAGAVIII